MKGLFVAATLRLKGVTVVVATCYTAVGIGAQGEHLKLLESIGRQLRALGWLFLLGGDWIFGCRTSGQWMVKQVQRGCDGAT